MIWATFRVRKSGELFRRPEGSGTRDEMVRLARATCQIVDYPIVLALLERKGQSPGPMAITVAPADDPFIRLCQQLGVGLPADAVGED